MTEIERTSRTDRSRLALVPRRIARSATTSRAACSMTRSIPSSWMSLKYWRISAFCGLVRICDLLQAREHARDDEQDIAGPT